MMPGDDQAPARKQQMRQTNDHEISCAKVRPCLFIGVLGRSSYRPCNTRFDDQQLLLLLVSPREVRLQVVVVVVVVGRARSPGLGVTGPGKPNGLHPPSVRLSTVLPRAGPSFRATTPRQPDRAGLMGLYSTSSAG